MSEALPACPACAESYTYESGSLLVCPMCAHEWMLGAESGDDDDPAEAPAITDAVGIEARDGLWDSPDLVPTAADIDDPSALITRLEARARGEEPTPDEFDDALARLLSGEDGGGSAADENSGESGPADDGPDERPV